MQKDNLKKNDRRMEEEGITRKENCHETNEHRELKVIYKEENLMEQLIKAGI